MKLKRKKTWVFAVFIGCLILPTLTVNGQGEYKFESQEIVSNSESLLSNVTIEMLSDLPSHRADQIPSVLPGSTFSIRFNVTNYSTQSLRELELFPQSNSFGTINNPVNDTRSELEQGESWISQEYFIETVNQNTGLSSALDLAIVLDQSGSMGDEINALTTELVGVIDEIDELVPDLRISLILFGGSSSNPYTDPSLVYPLTHEISEIAAVLANTYAGGSHEPWGDALWVAQNRLDWREEAAKLIVLITDEPCDGGVIIGSGSSDDYDGPLLYALFDSLSEENFILCSIAASGSSTLTKKQLEVGAITTDGQYILLGGEGPQTGDIPEIIGELIVYYAVELDFKISATVSHLNDLDTRESITKTFVVLLDDLPPEIDTWVYISEDFITEEKLINVMCEVKDVTGVPFVEIYYKFDAIQFWTIANASQVLNNSYVLTLPYQDSSISLSYYIYTEDWLGNTVNTEIYIINLQDTAELQNIYPGKRKEVILLPNQAVICKLIGNVVTDAYGVIFSTDHNRFDTLAADMNESVIVLDNKNVEYQAVLIQKGHVVKISLTSQYNAKVIIANVIPEILEFQHNLTREIDETDAFLFKLDNTINETEDRGFIADSQAVLTGIIIFDANTWEYIAKDSVSTKLPEKELYILVYAIYHTGEIFIGFDYIYQFTTYGHYYPAALAMNYWSIIIPILGIAAIATIVKRKRR